MTGAGDSLLAVDFGSTTTRAVLFDVVNGSYRFVSAGAAPTTLGPPFANVAEGLRNALDDLSATTGRRFVDEAEMVILPARGDGAGVDKLVATSSAGPPLKTVILGLLPDTSVESTRRAAASGYLDVLDVIGLGDRRRQEQQVDSILQARPDLVIIAGGIDGGSTEAVMRLAETVNVACQLMETGRQPRVLYVGNSALGKDVARVLRQQTEVTAAGNVRPTLDAEDLIPARNALANLYEAQRVVAYAGYAEVAQWASGGSGIKPTAAAFGRLIQFVSFRDVSTEGPRSGAKGTERLYSAPTPSLGVDLGSASTVLAAALNGRIWLNTQTGVGMGYGARKVLATEAGLDGVAQWLPVELPTRTAREYVLHKTLYPGTIPQEVNELYLEHALAREALRLSLREVRPGWPASWRGGERGLMPWFETIVAGGATLGGAPRPGQAALVLLDGLEPTGICSLVLDVNGIAPALGAAAAVEPLVVAQVWDSGALMRLATVVAPVGVRGIPAGQAAVRVKVAHAGGETSGVDVPAGSIRVIPLAPGRTATVTVQPLRNLDVGRGPGRSVTLRDLRGSAAGIIVDARGRPLALPKEARARREAVQRWLWAVEN